MNYFMVLYWHYHGIYIVGTIMIMVSENNGYYIMVGFLLAIG